MDLQFHFKYILLITCGLVLCGCSELPRDNILDPQNPDSIRPQRIMVEAFVNINNNTSVPDPPSYNQTILKALDSLQMLYPHQIIIAEYHRNSGTSGEYTDAYHLDANEVIYQNYLQAWKSNDKATPDIFINGGDAWIRGASSTQQSLLRLQEAISTLLTENSHFTIEATTEQNGNQMTPYVTLARLGKTEVKNILIRTLLIANISAPYHHRVVLGSSKSTLIDLLAYSEVQNYTLPAISTKGQNNLELIVYVTNQQETLVYQCIKQNL